MMNMKRILTIYFSLFLSALVLLPSAIMGSEKRIITDDTQAPLYFIQVNHPNKAEPFSLHGLSYTKLADSIVQFSPQKPWSLIILMEESIWISPVELNSVLLGLMEKITLPPEKMLVYAFNTSIRQIEAKWKNPISLQKSVESEVRLLDAIQRIHQMTPLQESNSVLCVIGSGVNTGNSIQMPSIFCPIWFIFPNTQYQKRSPYLETLSAFSGGRIVTQEEFEWLHQIELPGTVDSQIICFTVPYQWRNYQKKIRLNLQEGSLSTPIQLKYPMPWISLTLSLLLLLAATITIITFFVRKTERHKNSSKTHHYSFAWFEWESSGSEKHHQRIQSCEFTIGSNPNCHLTLQDDAISDFHALIEEKNTQFVISDLSSRHGVWVNQQKISSQLLSDKDIIQIGNIYLTFHQSHIKYESNEKIL